MSVQCNTYVMIGAVFPYGAFEGNYEELAPYMDSAYKGIEGKNGITVLYDGMNAEYIAVGKVIAKTDDWQGFDKPVVLDGDLTVEELEEFGNVLELAKGRLTGFRIRPFVISHYR